MSRPSAGPGFAAGADLVLPLPQALVLRAGAVGEVVDDQGEPDAHHPRVLGQRDSLLGREETALFAHAWRTGRAGRAGRRRTPPAPRRPPRPGRPAAAGPPRVISPTASSRVKSAGLSLLTNG